jgi:hypothetical protein
MCCSHSFVGTLTPSGTLIEGAWPPGPNQAPRDSTWRKTPGDSCTTEYLTNPQTSKATKTIAEPIRILDFLFIVGPQSEFGVVTVGHNLSARVEAGPFPRQMPPASPHCPRSLPFTTAWFLVIDG